MFSPEGKGVAYESSASGRFEIYVRPFPGPGGQWQISTRGGTQARRRADGPAGKNELYYFAPDNKLMAVSGSGTVGTFVTGTPEALFQTHMAQGTARQSYDVGRDGRFLISTQRDDASSEPIHLLLNRRPPG